ncbi:Ig-like domain-containing protein [Pseudopedobacter beijingensis]|uniref:Ig-like domain-containing protein n=1 Tax=Pseudopedobacter beijingensis TaxID=1207056 RepID=A0ABW4IBC2_9SPHI
MKKNLLKAFKWSWVLLLFQFQIIKAQTTLAPGDIAFIGFQTGGVPVTQDGFSFITLKDITATTKVYFTEKGWGGTTWVTSSTEPHLLWTVPAFTPAGTIVSVVETTTADVFTVTGTTGTSITFALGSGFNLSGGDQMLAYQSSTGAEPTSPTFIAGVHADYNSTDYDLVTTWNTTWDGTTGASGGNESALPTGLTNGVNCVSLFPAPGPEVANSKYTGTLTGTPTALLAAINNPANWDHHASNDLGITPSSYPTPSVSVASAPSITGQPSNSIICAGANTTFGVTANNATGYQWQVSTNGGSSFSNLSNAAFYSNVTTATLTITGATAGMNGYQYKCVVTGTATPNATSNSATLTVNAAPAITAQPSGSSICAGTNTSFTVTASNATGYQWQVNTGFGFINISNGAPYSGATTATLTITGATADMNAYAYRVKATGNCTPEATSSAALLTVNAAPAITAQPIAKSISVGGNAYFTVTAANATGYKWQVSTNSGNSYTDLSETAPYSGVTTSALSITGATAGMNGYLYRAVVSGTCTPNATSNGATLSVATTINSIVATGTSPSNQSIVAYTVTFGASVTGVNVSNFSLTPTGITGASVSSVTGSGTAYTVNVNTGSGDGTLRLNLANATNISPGISTTLPFTGDTYIIDKTPPTVTGVTNNGLYNTNKTITFSDGTATLDNVAFTSGSTVSAEGTHTLIATDAAGNSRTVIFTIDKTAPTVTGVTDNSLYNINKLITFSDGTATLDNVAFTSGSTVSAEGTHTLIATDAAGNSRTITFTIDKTAPTVTGVTSSTADGTYKAGNPISIQVNFSENVTVTGTPTLTLETGTTDRVVNYVSGSGTSTLTFSYTVQAGDISADLDYVSATALAFNSGTIKDAAGNSATLTLPNPGAAGSLGANKAIVIDAQAPTNTIASLSFSDDTGASNTDFITNTAAQTISGTLSANLASDEKVMVSMDNGATYTAATINVGTKSWSLANVTLSGSNTLIVVVQDLAGNRGTPRSQAYTLDTTAPTTTIASLAFSNDTGTSNTDFITNTAAQTISGTLSATLLQEELLYFSSDNGSTLTEINSSVTGTSFSLTRSLSGSNTIKLYVVDAAGNKGAEFSQNYILDLTAPTVAITSIAGANGASTTTSPIPVTITFSENVTGFTLGDIIITGGIAGNFSGNGATYTFNVTPTNYGTVTVNVAANVATDAAGNGNTQATQFTITYQNPLPVNLVSFTAKAENNVAKLQWQTASEQNNRGFEIYRSGDDKQFMLIGTVKGNSSTINDYSFTDKHPLASGNNYYKLVQVDMDGKATELEVKILNFALSAADIRLYPNPTANKATLTYDAGRYTKMILVDINGKVIKQLAIAKADSSTVVDVSALPGGTYIFRLTGSSSSAHIKMIKQ